MTRGCCFCASCSNIARFGTKLALRNARKPSVSLRSGMATLQLVALTEASPPSAFRRAQSSRRISAGRSLLYLTK
jgi:hypothetical protein